MKKLAIIYGSLATPVQRKALECLTKILLEHTLEYPVCIAYREGLDLSGFRCFYLGTGESLPPISGLSGAALGKAEEYAVVSDGIRVIIEGFDDAGMLYGVQDFESCVARGTNGAQDRFFSELLSEGAITAFSYTSAPTVKERGLWTWGHVIYDYRGYFENMLRLKMNRVIIWTDFCPVNGAQVVEYAHSCNIKVIWGFAWLWDTDCSKVDIRNLDGQSELIFEKFRREYGQGAGDGIYFQTFTELPGDSIDGVLIAEAAARFVNRTAALFYDSYPDMEIQFGLHATSVKRRLEFIKTVDPRIRIVWEDCGSFPFAYNPNDIETFRETKAFAEAVALLRGNADRFGVVTKGIVNLDWSKFEHLKGPHYLGVSSETVRKNRADEQKEMWKRVQDGWIANGDKALEMVRALCRCKNGDLGIFALVEDGMFEENIMYPVALYAEMLWDCHRDIEEIAQEVSGRDGVVFAR